MKQALNIKQQAGVTLLVSLIALVIMMLTSLSLIRSTDTSMILAGNYAFKRDLMNQAERAVPIIKAVFSTGALASANDRTTDKAANNYYASIQASNAQGIPNNLFNIADDNTNNIKDAASGVIVRYVIDRMSLAAGAPSIANGGVISPVDSAGDAIIGGSGSDSIYNKKPLNGNMVSLYRISIRATGPRSTETYLQVIFAI